MVKKPKVTNNETEPKPAVVVAPEVPEDFDDAFYRGKAGEYYIDEHGRHVPVPQGHKGDRE